ncbi:hypothetical protein K6U49_10105 [Vibrio alginolyticus]|uniref:hypothetical protein n=1 Tax=Vibrio alginolyticus TaxID=663 RepID=UPI001EE9C20B|nr:hypothetical protein [Vibrio alginolyticus]MCG6308937.1 hypothetical protein [Vibrio alginolyticus]
MISLKVEFLVACIALAIFAFGFFFRLCIKLINKLEVAEKEIKRLKLICDNPSNEVAASKLCKQRLEESEKRDSEDSLKNRHRKLQTPAVRRLLERLEEVDNSKPKKTSYIPRPIEIKSASESTNVIQSKRPSYNSEVWKKVDGKLVLRDTSEQANRRRQDSVNSSRSTSNKASAKISFHPFVVHSDQRD